MGKTTTTNNKKDDGDEDEMDVAGILSQTSRWPHPTPLSAPTPRTSVKLTISQACQTSSVVLDNMNKFLAGLGLHHLGWCPRKRRREVEGGAPARKLGCKNMLSYK